MKPPKAPPPPLAVVHPDGRIETLSPKGDRWTLPELQAAIGGGYVETLRLPGNEVALFDEEGAMPHKNLPPNPTASVKAGRRLVGIVAFGPRAVLGGGR